MADGGTLYAIVGDIDEVVEGEEEVLIGMTMASRSKPSI